MQAEGPLIQALQQRDPDALAQVFEQHADQVYRLAVSILHDEQQADGVVQNTFIALIEHIDNFKGQAKLSTWLYRVAYNECVGRLRRAKPQLDLDSMDDFMPQSLVDWQTIPDAVMSSDEANAQMQAAIAALSPVLRDVFLLRDVQELSTREAAEVLKIGESAVKVRLHRARLALREHLAAYFEEYA